MPGLREARAPEGLRLYAIGDIHGRLDLLREVHARIAADLVRRPCRRFLVVHLGDYVDRGPDSAWVIEHLIEFRRDGDAVCLAGNHDRFVTAFLDRPQAVGDLWLANGGEAALASWGVEVGRKTLKALRRELAAAMPPAHRAFLETLPLTEAQGDYLFVHAGIRPGTPLAKQRPEDLTGIREPFLSHAADHGCVVVHGHTAGPAPVVRPNRVGIDTRAYASGVLSCLALEDAAKGFLEPAGYAPLDVSGLPDPT